MSSAIPFSVLDLAPIALGGSASQAFANTLDLARHAGAWNYYRYWLAEHHNMTGIASAATAVVIGHVAGGTQKIRVGAGGVMLPNHAPLVIAEQFGTLESLFPGRIDLGLGRAPGSDQLTARALFAATEPAAPTRLRKTCWNCNAIFARRKSGSARRLCPAPVFMSRSGYSVRVCLEPIRIGVPLLIFDYLIGYCAAWPGIEIPVWRAKAKRPADAHVRLESRVRRTLGFSPPDAGFQPAATSGLDNQKSKAARLFG